MKKALMKKPFGGQLGSGHGCEYFEKNGGGGGGGGDGGGGGGGGG